MGTTAIQVGILIGIALLLALNLSLRRTLRRERKRSCTLAADLGDALRLLGETREAERQRAEAFAALTAEMGAFRAALRGSGAERPEPSKGFRPPPPLTPSTAPEAHRSGSDRPTSPVSPADVVMILGAPVRADGAPPSSSPPSTVPSIGAVSRRRARAGSKASANMDSSATETPLGPGSHTYAKRTAPDSGEAPIRAGEVLMIQAMHVAARSTDADSPSTRPTPIPSGEEDEPETIVLAAPPMPRGLLETLASEGENRSTYAPFADEDEEDATRVWDGPEPRSPSRPPA